MLLQAEDLGKQYGVGEQAVRALFGVTLAVAPGEFVVVMGPSGSGKSTLLQILGGLDRPTSGALYFKEQATTNWDDKALSDFRLHHIGFVFQSFHLLPTLTAAENVALPLLLSGQAPAQALDRARQVLDMVGLGNRSAHRPSQLSGGQMQRVAVARALVADPDIILADEPTGNLDTANGLEVLQLLKQCQVALGRTVIMVTHDTRATRFGTRLIELEDGKLVRDERARDRSVAAGQLD